MQMPETRYIAMTFVLLVFILFLIGSSISENCVDLGGCKQCWRTTQVVVSDPALCGSSGSCLAQPRDQQNNAIVDAVFCACANAKGNGYGDASLNRKIEETISAFTGFNLTVSEICEQPSTFLARVSYV